MKLLRIGGILALLVLCVGIAVGQDAAHDLDEAATKAGHMYPSEQPHLLNGFRL